VVISYCRTDNCNVGLPASDNPTLWCNYGDDPSNFLNQSCTGSCAVSINKERRKTITIQIIKIIHFKRLELDQFP
jgi:hypothetical protein